MKIPAFIRDENSPFYFQPTRFVSWKRERKSKFFIILVFLLFIFLYLSFHILHLFYYNTTTSATRGLYMAVPSATWERGDYVVVSCPKDYPPLAKEGILLLKQLEGLPGDTFQVTENALILRDKSYPIYHVVSYLPQLPQGEYTVPEDMYLFLNTMPYSFDSRYMGPITKDRLVQKVVLIFDADHAIKVIDSFRKELSQ